MSNSSSGSTVVRDGDIVHAKANHMSADPKAFNKAEPNTSKACCLTKTSDKAEPAKSELRIRLNLPNLRHPSVVTHGSDGNTLTIAPISTEPNQPCRPVVEVLPQSAAKLGLWGHIHTNPVTVSKSQAVKDVGGRKVTPDDLQRTRAYQAATKAAIDKEALLKSK
ncbi:hypothetical protein JB92DRAFT_2829031 [Gautieria morchelliformis]|nr:hypothetical protein JB92DRAFT_2829031 [Gautieria morchelliformis]